MQTKLDSGLSTKADTNKAERRQSRPKIVGSLEDKWHWDDSGAKKLKLPLSEQLVSQIPWFIICFLYLFWGTPPYFVGTLLWFAILLQIESF